MEVRMANLDFGEDTTSDQANNLSTSHSLILKKELCQNFKGLPAEELNSSKF